MRSERMVKIGNPLQLPFKEVPLLAILTRNILKPFPLSSRQYVSTVPEKNCMLPTFQSVRVSMEKMIDHQYRENGAGNTYSNYNQMKAYVDCSPNQPKKTITYRPFHPAIDKTLKFPEKYWPFLYLKFTRVLQFSSTIPRL